MQNITKETEYQSSLDKIISGGEGWPSRPTYPFERPKLPLKQIGRDMNKMERKLKMLGLN